MPLRVGVGRLMANAILNFHFDFLHTSLKSEYREHFIINIGKILITSKNQRVTIYNGKMGNNVHLTININRAINIGNIENI